MHTQLYIYVENYLPIQNFYTACSQFSKVLSGKTFSEVVSSYCQYLMSDLSREMENYWLLDLCGYKL